MTVCKYYHFPAAEWKNGMWVTEHNGKEIRAGPWSQDLKGWCRYIAPKKRYSQYDPCIHSNDNKIECPLKGLP